MLKPVLRACGILLALAAGGYFLVSARDAFAGRDLSALLDRQVFLASVFLLGLYTSSIIATATAWFLQLRAMDENTPLGKLLPILAATQFGKYLPGNVAHHIGRVALVRTAGVRIPAALFSIAYELLLALVACAHLGAVTLLWSPLDAMLPGWLVAYRIHVLAAITLGAAGILLCAPRIAVAVLRFQNRRKDSTEVPALGRLHLDLRTAVACYSLYALTCIMIGFGLWVVACSLGSNSSEANPFFFMGAFAVSWILGFIAPGAPAGLGIREGLLVAWFGLVMPPADAVILVIALRIATTAGDLINFSWSSILLYRQRAVQARDA